MREIKSKCKRSNDLILNLFFVVAPFSVSSTFNDLTPIIGTSLLMLLLTFLYITLYFLRDGISRINKFETNTLLLFIIPIFMSLMGILTAMIDENNREYMKYLVSKFPSRAILIFINIIILLGLLNITYNWPYRDLHSLIKKYYYGLFIFAIVGLWQFFHFLIDIPFLNINTRDYIHSVSSNSFFINNRLTSFADEPSYLAPLIIDLIILSFLISKKPIRPFFLGLFVLIFSYSGGGYLNLIVLIIFFIIGYFKYNNYKISFKNVNLLLLIFSFGVGTFFYYNKEIYNLIYPVLGRLNTIFDIKKHGRMFMITMPFLWVLNGNILNALFGYGPNSYNYLHLTKSLTSDQMVHVTSNNLFSDTVFELGYFGFISYILIFARFIYISFKNIYNNKFFFISMLLSVHLFTSSIYRADFMQGRFWILIFIILKLINIGIKQGDRDGSISVYNESK